MSGQDGLATDNPSLTPEEQIRLMEEVILPHFFNFHLGIHKGIPDESKYILSKLHMDREDEKVKALSKFAACKHDHKATFSKLLESTKKYEKLKIIHNHKSAEANEADERFKKMDEESEMNFQSLEENHKCEMNDMLEEQRIMRNNLKEKHKNELEELQLEDEEKRERMDIAYRRVLDDVTYYKVMVDCAKTECEEHKKEDKITRRALIDSELQAKQLQVINAGMIEVLPNDLPLATLEYSRIISLLGGQEKINIGIANLKNVDSIANVCVSLSNLGLPQNENFKTDGVSLTTKRPRGAHVDELRYRLYQALSYNGIVKYDSGKILEKNLHDKRAEIKANQDQILAKATLVNRKRNASIQNELVYTPRNKKRREELNRLYRSPSPGFGRLDDANSINKRARSCFTSPATEMLSQDTCDGSPAVFTPRTLSTISEKGK